jgi:hypothetical protein
LKEEKKMASKLFARGSMYGETELYECTVGQWDFTPTNVQVDRFISDMYAYLIERLEKLDDRLWWQPETSEIFYEDDEPEKPLPDESDSNSWWSEQINDFLGQYDYSERLEGLS